MATIILILFQCTKQETKKIKIMKIDENVTLQFYT